MQYHCDVALNFEDNKILYKRSEAISSFFRTYWFLVNETDFLSAQFMELAGLFQEFLITSSTGVTAF
ncbi:hypothetical protein HNY73_005552 [Argiope bruennichi]|uniref:Uncharacterized protein n=1 Tax=Argiope bruennichi TaxID=94029 RepID=A0A8T0FGZ5_ARGBR|nr:hypothetical protein HNY73_005552 [Argiope bruennichi]